MSKEVNEERTPRTVTDVKEMLAKHSNGEIQRTIQNCITILQNDHVLADPFIAIGKITLLQGDPGDGKSTMMMNLIAELSTGGKTPDGCKIGAPQKVIYQCSEDGVSDTIKPRLERCGADCRKIALSRAITTIRSRQC